jgi:hypothetical protein
MKALLRAELSWVLINIKIMKTEKLTLKEKVVVFVGTAILGSILFYSIPANLENTVSTLLKRENKEKIVKLNNRKYSGKLIAGLNHYDSYIFVYPPMNSKVPPLPATYSEYYLSNKNDRKKPANEFTLDNYRCYRNDQLEVIINHPSNPGFNARQDTLRILIERFNLN